MGNYNIEGDIQLAENVQAALLKRGIDFKGLVERVFQKIEANFETLGVSHPLYCRADTIRHTAREAINELSLRNPSFSWVGRSNVEKAFEEYLGGPVEELAVKHALQGEGIHFDPQKVFDDYVREAKTFTKEKIPLGRYDGDAHREYEGRLRQVMKDEYDKELWDDHGRPRAGKEGVNYFGRVFTTKSQVAQADEMYELVKSGKLGLDEFEQKLDQVLKSGEVGPERFINRSSEGGMAKVGGKISDPRQQLTRHTAPTSLGDSGKNSAG